MRQYRGLTKDGKWVYGWYFELDGMSFIENQAEKSNNRCTIEVIPESVGQSTGLKDKNGKDIWEGDICKETCEHITSKGPNEDGWTSSILPIEFRYGMFCFGYHTNDLAYFVKCWGLKVIGNIHQNPELLEKP